MAGRKRAAESNGEVRQTRSKVAKTAEGEGSAVKTRNEKKQSKQSAMATSTFKSRALPLHVNLTHTPPVIGGDDTKDVAQLDPGFVGSTTLVPSTFKTGSYGWKGSRRITVELENSEGGEKEKVQVMLTINATVLGSKNAEEEGEEEADDSLGEAKESGPSV